MFFTQVVDRAQLGDAHRGKAEAEMIRIVHRVHKGAGKTDRAFGSKNGSKPILGGVCPNLALRFTRRRRISLL